MKRIGILGGSSDQATAEYYRRINTAINERLGGWHTGEILISSMDFAMSERFVRNGDWEGAGAYLSDRALALERAGADFLICVSNTLHRVAAAFVAGLNIPFLHIADPTGQAIQEAGMRTVGLLGTEPVMSGDFLKERYAERFGLQIIVPSESDQLEADRIIFDELCRGVFSSPSKDWYLRTIRGLQSRGAEGIILGCTEIPLLISQLDFPSLALFDTAALHVKTTVDWALQDT